MVDIEYANAYSEVLEILKFIPKIDYEKIDKEILNVFEINCNKEYKFSYNQNKTLNEQNVSPIAKTIIAILFRDYWATEIQKEKILEKERYDLEQIEKEKREKYNSDNLFKKKEKEEISVVIYENKIWYRRTFKFINDLVKRIFKK